MRVLFAKIMSEAMPGEYLTKQSTARQSECLFILLQKHAGHGIVVVGLIVVGVIHVGCTSRTYDQQAGIFVEWCQAAYKTLYSTT